MAHKKYNNPEFLAHIINIYKVNVGLYLWKVKERYVLRE